MTSSQASTFNGFGATTMRFLDELAEHNERPWFAANKHRYESLVLEPALAFIEAMAPRLARVSKHFRAVPKRTGGSLMRVYRDTRFAADKQPYKTNVGIQFRHERGRDVHAPGFYVHIEPRGSFLGAGIWRPDAQALAAIRAEILDHPAAWQRARDRKGFREHFELGGDRLKRLPSGVPAEAPHGEDLKRKDFIAICRVTAREAARADFVELVAARFKSASPLMAFLCGALDLSC